MKTLEFIVRSGRGTSEDLVSFLATSMKISKRSAKGYLDRRKVFVNGQRVWMAKHRLEKGDIVIVIDDADQTSKTIPVLYEDSNLMIVDKPAGLLSYNDKASVESLVRLSRNDNGLKIVHRLDRDTSGCLIISKNEQAFEKLVSFFRSKKIFKKYHALVYGEPFQKELRIEKPIDGKTAVTKVRVLHSVNGFAHVAAVIETGRTHQIRKHLAHVRHPVLGDSEYSPPFVPEGLVAHLPRLMLHSSDIELPCLEPGKDGLIRVSSPLPEDFRKCMKYLGLS